MKDGFLNRLMYHQLIICVLSITIMFAQNEVDIHNLQIKDGMYYEPLGMKPYTGRIIDVNNHGNIILETDCVRGEISGLWITWYDNGKKESEGYYENGIKVDCGKVGIIQVNYGKKVTMFLIKKKVLGYIGT